MGIAFFVISAIATAALGIFIIKNCLDTIKAVQKVDYINFVKKNAWFSLAFAATFTMMMFAIYAWAKITPTTRDVLSVAFGAPIFSFLAICSLQTFMLHYYDQRVPEEINKWLFRILCISFPLMFVFVFLLSDGYADYLNLEEPLVNGINFTEGWSRPGSYGPSTNVAFYALCILSGAIYVYFLCDHKFYKIYGKHRILESLLYVAFPAGIIGARLWYVIGNWEVDFAHQPNPFLAALDFTQGGLTILGGAIMGIAAGLIWVLIIWRRSKYSIQKAVDIIVPAILIAQAVGRWGNFFNCEVHGFSVDESYFAWLPKIIFNNAHFSSSYSSPLTGQVFVPLFFIECIVNLLGYFVIAHLFGIKLKKYLKPLDLGFMYVVWYGMTRVLMEPLRDSSFNMGTDGYWSWTWSLVFVLAGVLLILGNHIFRFIYEKKTKTEVLEDSVKRGIIGFGVLFAIALGFIVPGAYLMSTNEFAQTLVFNEFNVGLILLVTGIAVVVISIIPVFDVIKGFEYRKQQENA